MRDDATEEVAGREVGAAPRRYSRQKRKRPIMVEWRALTKELTVPSYRTTTAEAELYEEAHVAVCAKEQGSWMQCSGNRRSR